jgi:hypothetical protein
MRKLKYSEVQIIRFLKQVDSGRGDTAPVWVSSVVFAGIFCGAAFG